MNKKIALIFLLPLTLFSCGKQVHIEIVNSDVSKGIVTQGGTFAVKSTIILQAQPNEGFLFTGWYKDNTALSYQNPYIYTVPENDVTITAKWEEYSTQTFIFNMNTDDNWTISHYHGSYKDIIIPKTHYGVNVNAIGDATFAHEHTIETVAIHDGIVKIGNYAFEDTLISSITLPKKLHFVGDEAFSTWKDNQRINIYHESITVTEPLIRTKWGWVLNEVKDQNYYTCSESGNALIYLI